MKLLYIMDPLCGWCYGNSENMLHLEQELADQISIDVMPGGMLAGDNTRYQDMALIGMIRSADMRLRSITGVPMSDAYDRLLDNTTILLDSEPPCRAINTIKKIAPEKVLKFSSALARARYVEGVDNTKIETFILVCKKLDIDTDLFLMNYDSEDMKRNTREIFTRVSEYTSGYPSIFLVSSNSSMIPIPLMGYQYANLKNEIMKYI